MCHILGGGYIPVPRLVSPESLNHECMLHKPPMLFLLIWENLKTSRGSEVYQIWSKALWGMFIFISVIKPAWKQIVAFINTPMNNKCLYWIYGTGSKGQSSCIEIPQNKRFYKFWSYLKFKVYIFIWNIEVLREKGDLHSTLIITPHKAFTQTHFGFRPKNVESYFFFISNLKYCRLQGQNFHPRIKIFRDMEGMFPHGTSSPNPYMFGSLSMCLNTFLTQLSHACQHLTENIKPWNVRQTAPCWTTRPILSRSYTGILIAGKTTRTRGVFLN